MRIRELRKSKGYTQLQVQMMTGIDQSDYSKIERELKEPTFTQCKALAELFGTSMDYIAGRTDNLEPYGKMTQ